MINLFHVDLYHAEQMHYLGIIWQFHVPCNVIDSRWYFTCICHKYLTLMCHSCRYSYYSEQVIYDKNFSSNNSIKCSRKLF